MELKNFEAVDKILLCEASVAQCLLLSTSNFLIKFSLLFLTLRILAICCSKKNSPGKRRPFRKKPGSWNCYREGGRLGPTHPSPRTIYFNDGHRHTHHSTGILRRIPSLRVSGLVPDSRFYRGFRLLQVRKFLSCVTRHTKTLTTVVNPSAKERRKACSQSPPWFYSLKETSTVITNWC